MRAGGKTLEFNHFAPGFEPEESIKGGIAAAQTMNANAVPVPPRRHRICYSELRSGAFRESRLPGVVSVDPVRVRAFFQPVVRE